MSRFQQAFNRTGQEIKTYGKQGYNYLETTDPKKVFKVLFMIFGIIIAFMIFKSVRKFFGGLLGIPLTPEARAAAEAQAKADLETQIELDKQDTNTSWNPLTNSYSTNKDTYGDLGASYQEPSDHKGLEWSNKKKVWENTAATKKKVRALIDKIYTLNKGYNILYYPEIVNKLANLHSITLKYAVYYFDEHYKTAEKKGLYGFLNSQYTGFGYYDPALGKLKNNGYTW